MTLGSVPAGGGAAEPGTPWGGTDTANGRPELTGYLSVRSRGSDMPSSRSRCPRRDSPGEQRLDAVFGAFYRSALLPVLRRINAV